MDQNFFIETLQFIRNLKAHVEFRRFMLLLKSFRVFLDERVLKYGVFSSGKRKQRPNYFFACYFSQLIHIQLYFVHLMFHFFEEDFVFLVLDDCCSLQVDKKNLFFLVENSFTIRIP
jgi:hypothetical protein